MPRKGSGVYKAKNGTWFFKAWVHVLDEHGEPQWKQTTRRGFHTSTEARRARRKFVEAAEVKSKSAAPDAERSSVTVAELIEMYLAEAESMGRLAAKTLFDYRNYAASYIVPRLGSTLVTELTRQELVGWQVHLSEGGAVKTGGPLLANSVRLARAPLNGALRFAVDQGLVESNLLSTIPPPRRERKIASHWSPDQARHFLALNEGDRLYPLWAFLLGSGVRIGEVVWLRWDQVDLAGSRVRITEFASTLGYEVVRSAGKSKDSIRTVDLDTNLVEVLAQQREFQQSERSRNPNYDRSEFVFTKKQGGHYHPQYLSKLLGQISVEIGLPRLTAHGLRHTSATLMLASGVPPKVAAERLGHADATLFTNLYSHVTPTMQEEAARAIGTALFGDASQI